MARYFFDIYDNEQVTSDTKGLECASRQEVREAAISVLPAIARDELPDGNRHSFRVRVRDHGDRPVFQASLTLEAGWLDEEGPSSEMMELDDEAKPESAKTVWFPGDGTPRTGTA
jgi:hypothetical protein